MSRRASTSVLAAALLSLCGTTARPAPASTGTREEAKALVNQGVAFLQKHGVEKGLAEITRGADKEGSLVLKDLYIFAYDFTGKVLAHGANKKLIGRSLFDMQDPDGKYMIRELIAAARSGEGWVDYKWSHPETKKIQKKSAYVRKVNDELWIGCGAYWK